MHKPTQIEQILLTQITSLDQIISQGLNQQRVIEMQNLGVTATYIVINWICGYQKSWICCPKFYVPMVLIYI